MIWWFLILACSTGAVVWALLSLYFYVRRQMNSSSTKTAGHDSP
jgi:hypothetical protein